MKLFGILAMAVLTIFFVGCGGNSSVPVEVNQSSKVIYVSIPPLAELAKEIAGSAFEVRSMVQLGDDPHSFSPSAKQLIEISQARAVFTVGMPFLQNLCDYLETTAPGLEMIDLQAGILMMDAAEHSHEHEGHEHHDESDIHTWLSPSLLRKQVSVMGETLAAYSPEDADEISKTTAMIVERFEKVDAELKEQLAPIRGRAIYVHHPAFAYFAEHYGLRQESVELGGRTPSAKRMADLIAQAKSDGVRVIFSQPQFDPSSAEKIAEAIGGTVVPVDPLAADLHANFKSIGVAVATALEK